MRTEEGTSKKIITLFMAIAFLMSAYSPFTSIGVTGEGSGDYPPPQSGDWKITQETHVSNETIFMNGNIFVENGGSLYLENITIIFNSTKNGEFRLEIQNGGALYVYNTTFDRGTEFTYGFRLLDGGRLRMENTTIKHCGYDAWNYYGLVIYGDDVVIRNSLFTEGYMGIYSYSATAPVYEKNRFINNTHVGLYLHTVTNALVRNNIFEHNNYGIYCYSCTGGIVEGNSVMNNTEGNVKDGIDLRHSSGITVKNNYVNNTNRGLWLYACHHIEMHHNLVTNTSIGVLIQYSDNVTVYQDRYFHNSYGAHISYSNTNITFQHNNVSYNGEYNLFVYRTNNSIFQYNEVHNSTKYHGLVLRECSHDMVKGNNISGIISIALWLWNSENITLHDNVAVDSYIGYYLYYSGHNRFYEGVLKNNDYGIFVRNSSKNWIVNTTSTQNINNDVYLRNASTELYFINTEFSTRYILDDASNFSVFNYLDVEVRGRTGAVPGVDVDVMEILTGKVVYSTAYFGGSDPKTDDAGMVKGIIALYSITNRSGTVFSRVKIRINDHGVYEEERYSDMDTSHTEVFIKNAITVDQNGNGDYVTIQEAVNEANSGDTILVAPGTYPENVVVDKELNIYGKGKVIVDGMNATGFDVKYPTTLANITIINASTDLYIENNTFVFNVSFSSVNYTGNHFLAVGHYIDVITVDDNGAPLSEVNLTIENWYFPSRSYLSDPIGKIPNIALLEYANTSSNHYLLNPYYLNASKEFRFANQTINITSNTNLTLTLTRHGEFGTSVLTMDINMDGYMDYVVGAPYDDEGGVDAGAVFIFYGATNGRDTLRPIDADQKIIGVREYSHFGSALASGDVNGDGLVDLIVGADGYNSTDIHGIVGKYYDGEDFTGYRYSRIDSNINFPWEDGGPPDVGDKFSVKWDGYLYIKKEDSYMFYFEHDDGVRFYINDNLVLDAWSYTGNEDSTPEPVYLTKGFHAIHIDFFDAGGPQKIILKWSTPTLEKEIIPSENFYISTQMGPGNGTVYIFSGEIFDGRKMDASMGTRIDGDYPGYGNHLSTGKLNDDNRTDIMVGYENGTRVIYGGPMISSMTFDSDTILSNEWEAIISGNGGAMYLTGDGELAIDGSEGGNAYAYSLSKEIFDYGMDISIVLEAGDGTMFLAGIDYQVPEEDVSNLSKQESHTLFALYSNGQVKYWPTYGGSVKIEDYEVNGIYTFRVKITEDYHRLLIYLNGEKKIDEKLTGWHPVYLKLGDSYNYGQQITKIVDFFPSLVQRDIFGLESALILNNNNTTIAAKLGKDTYLLEENLSELTVTSYQSQDDFQGNWNFTTFDHGITLSPFNYVMVVPNGNFDMGWQNWSQVQNTQGQKDSGTRWAIIDQRNGDWWVHNGSTGGFGSDVDELPNSNSYRDCRGMLKSEVFTLPDDVDILHFWFHFRARSFEAAGGWQGDVADSINYSLFNADNDRRVKNLYSWSPSSGTSDNEASGEINADVSDLHGMNLYFGMEIITNHGQRDKAIVQVDDIFGARENEELRGSFTSSFIQLTNFSAFIPVWDGHAHGGNISLYYRINESDPWRVMENRLQILSIPASSIQYRVVMEGVHGNPYPVLTRLHFTFFNSIPERVQRGQPFDAGEILEKHTLGVVNGTMLTLYHGKDPRMNISSNHEISALSSPGDVDGNGRNDLFVSSNNRVYLFLLDGNTWLNTSDANYSFEGEEGFGYSIYHGLAGSPLEKNRDGRVYLLPVLRENLALIGVSLENHTLIYPDTNLTLRITIKNTGLERMEEKKLTLNITAPAYYYEENLSVSLDAGSTTVVSFVWSVPRDEGVNYTIRLLLSDDMQNMDNRIILQVKTRYHGLVMRTAKDYDAVAVNGTAHYCIMLKNTGTLGEDDVRFNVTVPSGWQWHLQQEGTNFTHIVVEDKVSFDFYVKTSSPLGVYPISISAISENGTTNFTLTLYVYIVDRDLVPLEVKFLREDGKEGTPIAGENTTVILRVFNNGTQDAYAFTTEMYLDGENMGWANASEAYANYTVELVYHTVFTHGDHTLLFRIDTEDSVKEYDEKNNELTWTFTVKPEISTTPYTFVLHVTDLYGNNLSDMLVRASSGSNVIENLTNSNGISLLTVESYPEGDVYLVEAISGSLYAAESVAIYSEDAVSHIEFVVGEYSTALQCREREKDIMPNGSQLFEINITNTGDFNDTYSLSITGLPEDWGAEIEGEGVVNATIFVPKGGTEVIELNISSSLYAPAHERYDIIFRVVSQFSPYSSQEITLRISVLPVDKIVMTTDSTEEIASPGDPVSHRITIRNDGNAERDIIIAVSGDTEYIEITRTEFHLSPGEESQFWLTIYVPNLRAGTVIHQELYGIVAGVGPTEMLSFSTTLRVKHRFSVEVEGQTLQVINEGNVEEVLWVSGSIQQYGNVTPVLDNVVLDMGESVEIPLIVDMADMSIPAGSGIPVFVTLFNGEGYYNSTHTLIVPEIYNFSLIPLEEDIEGIPGEKIGFEMKVVNTGNVEEEIFFSGSAESGYLIVPSPVVLQPSQEKIVKFYVQTVINASGNGSIICIGRAHEKTVSVQIFINLTATKRITLSYIAVAQISGEVRYTLNLYNSGEVDETIVISTNCGVLDTQSVMLEPNSAVQFYLHVPDNIWCQNDIYVNASAGVLHSSLTLSPPPRSEIKITSLPPFTVKAPVWLEGTGNYLSYQWTIDGVIILQGRSIHYNFSTAGNHTIELLVTDSRDLSYYTTMEIQITNLPPVLHISPLLTGKVGEEIEFDARDSTDPDGVIVDYIWEMDNETIHGPHIYHSFSQAGIHEIRLTIVDNLGSTNTTVTRITVTDNGEKSTTTTEKKEINTAFFLISMLILSLVTGGIIFLYFQLNRQEDAVLREIAELEKMTLISPKKKIKAQKIPKKPKRKSVPQTDEMVEVNICPSCGAEVPAQFNFCNKCGAPMKEMADTSQKKTGAELEYRVCQRCGAHVPPHFHYCNRCGAAMDVGMKDKLGGGMVR